MNKTIEKIYSNIKLNQYLTKDILALYHHAAQIKSPILLDTSARENNQNYEDIIIKNISKKLCIPCIKVNTSEYSVEKMPGRHLSDILIQLINEAEGNIELAQRGVVVLDNMDSLFKLAEGAVATVLNVELPRLIHGDLFQIVHNNQKISFDTSNVTFIGKGDFSDINELKMKSGYNKNGSRYLGGFQEIIEVKGLELVDKNTITNPEKNKIIVLSNN